MIIQYQILYESISFLFSYDFLFLKVVTIFGLFGACRMDEFANIYQQNVKVYPDMIVVEIDIDKTKTKVPQTFVIPAEFYPYVKKYMDLRQPKTLSTRFFMNYV
jgi:hypothetical protein